MNAKVWVRALAPEPPPPIAGVSVTKGLLAEIAEWTNARIPDLDDTPADPIYTALR